MLPPMAVQELKRRQPVVRALAVQVDFSVPAGSAEGSPKRSDSEVELWSSDILHILFAAGIRWIYRKLSTSNTFFIQFQLKL